MDKIILSNNQTLEFSSINLLENGLAITFSNKTITELESLMTKANLSIVKLTTENDDVYGTYNNLSCLSITKIISNGNVVVTLYKEDETEERISTLEDQNAEMIFALVMGGLM